MYGNKAVFIVSRDQFQIEFCTFFGEFDQRLLLFIASFLANHFNAVVIGFRGKTAFKLFQNGLPALV